MKTVKEKITALKVQEAEAAVEQLQTHRVASTAVQAGMAIGVLGGLDALASTLTSRVIRGLQTFRDNKLHEQLGFARFDEFLNTSEYSPMTYRQFHTREQTLESEGDQVFDLLNSVRIPASRRKLLTSGFIEIDGETVVVGEERIALDDRARVCQAISDLTQQASNLSAKLDKQSKVIEKGKEDLETWKRKVDEAKLSAIPADSPEHPFGQALLYSIAALTQLARAGKEMNKEQLAAQRDNALRQVTGCVADLYAAFDIVPGDDVEPIPGLSDDDLSSLMDQ